MNLSDYIVISDTDITYANSVSSGICNDCNKEVLGKSARCLSCKIILNRIQAKMYKRRKQLEKIRLCLDCGTEITKLRRCIPCRDRHIKTKAMERYEADRRLSKFYTPS